MQEHRIDLAEKTAVDLELDDQEAAAYQPLHDAAAELVRTAQRRGDALARIRAAADGGDRLAADLIILLGIEDGT